MPRPHRALLCAALALFAGCRLSPDPHATTPEQDLSAVRAVLERQQAAWNAGDIDAFVAEGYWNSPALTFLSGGDWNRGYDETLARFHARYGADTSGMGTLTFSSLEAELLGPASALVRGRWHLAYAESDDLGGLFSLVLRRTQNGWRIVHDHTSVPSDDESENEE